MINTKTIDMKSIWYDWIGLNDWLFTAINSIRHPVYDDVMKKISWLGEHENFPYYLAAIFAVFIFSLLQRLIARHPIKWPYITSWFGVFVVLGAGYFVNGAIVTTIKSYTSYPRPYVAMASTGKVYKLEQTEATDDYRSFPSGHVAFTTFMLVALAPFLNSALMKLGILSVLLMAWSRISLGMHFPVDTIFSVIITLPTIMILRAILYNIMNRVLNIKC